MGYEYEEIDKSDSKPPYMIYKVKDKIPAFTEVHLTVPTGEEEFKSLKDDAWKYPHVTFLWGNNKLHGYIRQKKNGKYGSFDSKGESITLKNAFGTVFLNIVNDEKIKDILFDTSVF